MNDRLVGEFEDEETAQRAVEALVARGISRDQVRMDRVLEQEYRGLGDTDRVHSLIHAPSIDESEPVTDDAGTLIVVIQLDQPSQTDGEEPDDRNAGQLSAELERLGATETKIVKATPGLDL